MKVQALWPHSTSVIGPKDDVAGISKCFGLGLGLPFTDDSVGPSSVGRV